jgi:hypothetical protein
MIAKIRELNLDDLKNVSGGVTLLATATKLPVSSSLTTQVMTTSIRPTTTVQTFTSSQMLAIW